METIVINLFGGPGVGKSTIAALLFGELKKRKINCELVLEYAKDKVWEENNKTLDDQIYVFGKQYHKIWRLLGKVDIIITDSPLLLSAIYDKTDNEILQKLVIQEFKKLNNYNFYIYRTTQYESNGRLQTEKEALKIDSNVLKLLQEVDSYDVIDIDNAVEYILNKINK